MGFEQQWFPYSHSVTGHPSGHRMSGHFHSLCPGLLYFLCKEWLSLGCFQSKAVCVQVPGLDCKTNTTACPVSMHVP
jgi:hypothetical protein